MKRFLLILILFGSISAKAQEKTFPDDFLGIYKGDLVITNNENIQNVPMEFHLTATDSVDIYNYVLVYIVEGKPSPRHYTLKVKDKAKGQFIVDENNGILLSANCVDNTLYSVFEVEGNLLTTIERFYDDKMDFEIIFSSQNKKQILESDKEVPTVKVFPVTVIQKATLIKQ